MCAKGKDNMKKKFMYMNVLIPLIIGGVLYYAVSPEVIFVEQIDRLTGMNLHINCKTTFIKIIRNYVPDILWAYALMFALILIMGNKTADIWKMYMVAGLFSILIEVLQLTGLVKGTFDIKDIIVEIIAELVAVFIIKKQVGFDTAVQCEEENK